MTHRYKSLAHAFEKLDIAGGCVVFGQYRPESDCFVSDISLDALLFWL